MQHATHETRTTTPTPEQLITLLDAQLHLACTKHASPDHTGRRVSILIGGLLFIVVGGGAALLLLQHLLSDLRPSASPPAPVAGQNANF